MESLVGEKSEGRREATTVRRGGGGGAGRVSRGCRSAAIAASLDDERLRFSEKAGEKRFLYREDENEGEEKFWIERGWGPPFENGGGPGPILMGFYIVYFNSKIHKKLILSFI